MDKLYIETDAYELPATLLDLLKKSPALKQEYVRHLMTKLAYVEEQLGGNVAIDKDNAFVVISVFRQQRHALKNAIDQVSKGTS